MVDKSSIDGRWQAVTATLAGEPMPETIVAATKLQIQNGEYQVDVNGTLDSGSCIVNHDVIPVQLRIEGRKGPNAGKTFLAIAKHLQGSKLLLAYDLSGLNYPTSFLPSTEKSNYVVTFEPINDD